MALAGHRSVINTDSVEFIMWVKIGGQYYRDLKVYTPEFVLECNDIDGCVMRVRAIGGWRRKMQGIIRDFNMPLTVGRECEHVRYMMRERSSSDSWWELADCIEASVEWVAGRDFKVSRGLVIDFENVVNNRPPHGMVVNIKEASA